MPEFVVFDPSTRRAWRFRPSERWLRANDNGHAVSIGFRLGEDILEESLVAFIRAGKARPVDYEAELCTPRPW